MNIQENFEQACEPADFLHKMCVANLYCTLSFYDIQLASVK